MRLPDLGATTPFTMPELEEIGHIDKQRGWWMKPHWHNGIGGGNLLLGPVQFNWYNRGFRIHFTWPFRCSKTFTLRSAR